MLVEFEYVNRKRQMIEPYRSMDETIHITKEAKEKAIKTVREGLIRKFDMNSVIYYEMTEPCKMYQDTLPVKYGPNYNYMHLVVAV